MSLNDFLQLMPLLMLTFAALILMLVIAAWRNHKIIYVITAISFAAAFLSLFELGTAVPYRIAPLLVIDGLGVFYMGLLLATALLISMLSYAYFEQQQEQKEEYYILLVLATLGACVLVISTHFASLFLGLEVLSVSLYALVSYLRVRGHSVEAGIKYLILAAFSSAFLLFGMALVYFSTGAMSFAGIAVAMSAFEELPLLLLTGFGMMLVGIGFKLSLVPFHMWTPDVYEGAPAPVTAFVATVSKGGVLGLLIRFFIEVDGYRYPTLLLIFTIMAIASMFAGNLLALLQQNVKRILAYSSIAHLGYVLVAFLAGNQMGIEAVTFYLVAYFITTVGAFGTVALLSGEARDAERLDDYRGLLWRRPWTATVFTAMLLSLAGIPLTAGFVGKFYVLAAGVNTRQWLLVVMLVLNSVIGLYYYIKIIAVMFQQTEKDKAPRERLRPSIHVAGAGTLTVLILLLLWVGVYPTGLLQLIQGVLSSLPAVVAR